MGLTIGVEKWAAWAPNRSGMDDWSAWLTGDILLEQDVPDLGFLPPMQRRRLSLLSRISLWLAHECLDPDVAGHSPGNMATVFASRYGEYERAYSILQGLSTGESPSPAAFSQSVHNTSSGLYSIISGSMAASTTIAAGPSSLEAGFVEATLQAQKCSEQSVLFIYDDLPLPVAYGPITALDSEPFGIAMLLKAKGAKMITLNWRKSQAGTRWSDPSCTDRGQALVKFLLSQAPQLSFDDGRLEWQWSNNHA